MTLRQPSTQKTYLIAAVIILVIISLFFLLSKKQREHKHENRSVTVEVTTAQQKPMPVVINLPGIVNPTQTVSVQPQVSGVITQVNFHYGDKVKAGQVLFQINPAPLQAQLEQAKANLAQEQAQLISLKNNFERSETLYKKKYLSAQEYDQIHSSYLTGQAKIAADEQAIKQAEISLNYTRILAPISGKTGNVTVKKGDVVTSNSNQTLVTINRLNPLEVDFYLPQRQLSHLRRYQAEHPIQVEIWREDLKKQLATGKLFFVDNQVSATGTVLLKANVDNKNHKLWPGQMVAIKLILTVEPNAMVIPTEAVQIDQAGNFVFAVKNHHAVVQPIKIDRQLGANTVVASGLEAGEQIVSVAPPNLDNNSPIQIASK